MYIPAPHTEIDSLHSQGGVFVVEVDLYMESIYTNVVKISMGLLITIRSYAFQYVML